LAIPDAPIEDRRLPQCSGVFLSKFLFIVLVVALLVALFGRRSRV